MARQHFNGLVTTLGANLTNVATTITFTAALTFAGGTPVPTLAAGDTFRLALLSPGGVLLEVVEVTAYTSGGTTATITRAVESTTAVAHTLGDPVVSTVFGSDVHFVGAKATRSGALTVTAGASTAFPWDAEEYDTDAFHDTVTNNSRLTVPAGLAGKYLITFCLALSANLAIGNRFLLAIWKNGSGTTLALIDQTAASAQPMSGVVVAPAQLAAGDFVEGAYFIGGAVAVTQASMHLAMHRIGA